MGATLTALALAVSAHAAHAAEGEFLDPSEPEPVKPAPAPVAPVATAPIEEKIAPSAPAQSIPAPLPPASIVDLPPVAPSPVPDAPAEVGPLVDPFSPSSPRPVEPDAATLPEPVKLAEPVKPAEPIKVAEPKPIAPKSEKIEHAEKTDNHEKSDKPHEAAAKPAPKPDAAVAAKDPKADKPVAAKPDAMKPAPTAPKTVVAKPSTTKPAVKPDAAPVASAKQVAKPESLPVPSKSAPRSVAEKPPVEKSTQADTKTEKIVEKAAPKNDPPKVQPLSSVTSAPVAPRVEKPGFYEPPAAPGGITLEGMLDRDTELGPNHSPVVIRGDFVIPVDTTLKIRAGTVVQLKSASKPDAAAPAKSADLWVWGSLLIEGVTGNPVEVANLEKEEANLLFYGAGKSKLEGLRVKNTGVAQSGGVVQWTNCEFANVKHYALAAGAALLTQCTFRSSGGMFATYNTGPWSLLVRRCVFDNCREGVVLGTDPGEARLVLEKNHFINTRGAHLRVMPPANGKTAKGAEAEFLIGENWYGTVVPEEIDMRVVDRRLDPALHARLNIRPPAEQPYANVGAGVSAAVIANAVKEQQPVVTKLLTAHAAHLPKTADNASDDRATAMSRAIKK